MTALKIALILWIGGCCLGLGKNEKIDTKQWYEKLPVVEDLRQKFVLFSWIGTDGSYRFALIPNKNGKQGYRFLNRFDRRRTQGVTLEALQRELGTLAAGSLVTWIKDSPNKIEYPDRRVIQTIKKRCARLHLDMAFNEIMHESPDV
jgi:hypothetical protein